MSNPWAQSFEELRSPYLQEKKAKKDYDGDGKIESGTDEYMGSKDKAIKKAMAMRGKKKVAEHHQKDADGNTIPHEDEGDGTPSSVEEMAKKFGPGGDPIKKPGFVDKALDKLKQNTPVKKVDKAHYEPEGEVIEAKIDTVDPKNKRKRRNEREFGKQTKPYDPDTKEMKTSMGKFMNSMRHDKHNKKRGVKTKGMGEEVVLEADKKGSGSGTKDACYKKVKASAKVWPSAYASGRLVQCRKKGAANYGNSKKEEFDFRIKSFDDMVGECWKTHKKQGMKMKGGKMVPNCVPKNEETQIDEMDGSKLGVGLATGMVGGGIYLMNKAKQAAQGLKKKMNKRLNPQEEVTIGEEGINNDPAFDIMRPGGKNSPFNADGTPKRKSLNKVRGTAFKGSGALTNEEVFIEALKGKRLEIDDSGKVKNKIEINPEVKTEAAKAPVKK